MLTSILNDITLFRSSFGELKLSRSMLITNCLPIGSVEFVREAAAVLQLNLPTDLSYPPALQPWLYRNIELATKREFSQVASVFVKPADQIKAFSGFLYPEQADRLDDYVTHELGVLLQLPDDTRIWLSDPVSWVSEWRYYVCDGKIIGKGRYDDGPDDALEPDDRQVLSMIEAYSKTAPVSYGLDVGVLNDGRTALVEVNDAWALGLYRGTTSDAGYLNMLWRRWQQLKQ